LISHPSVKAMIVTLFITALAAVLMINLTLLIAIRDGAKAAESNRAYLMSHVTKDQIDNRRLHLYKAEILELLCKDRDLLCPAFPADIPKVPHAGRTSQGDR